MKPTPPQTAVEWRRSLPNGYLAHLVRIEPEKGNYYSGPMLYMQLCNNQEQRGPQGFERLAEPPHKCRTCEDRIMGHAGKFYRIVAPEEQPAPEPPAPFYLPGPVPSPGTPEFETLRAAAEQQYRTADAAAIAELKAELLQEFADIEAAFAHDPIGHIYPDQDGTYYHQWAYSAVRDNYNLARAVPQHVNYLRIRFLKELASYVRRRLKELPE